MPYTVRAKRTNSHDEAKSGKSDVRGIAYFTFHLSAPSESRNRDAK